MNIKVCMRFVIILVISIVLSYLFSLFGEFVVKAFPEQAFWLEKLVLLIFLLFFTLLVMIPFAKLFGIKIVK